MFVKEEGFLGTHLGKKEVESKVGLRVSQPLELGWSSSCLTGHQGARPLYPHINQSLTQAAPGRTCDLGQGKFP